MRVFSQRRNESAELVLGGLVGVVRFGEFADEGFLLEAVGFQQIIERVAVVSQLGVDQSHEEVGVHAEVVGEVHWPGD